MASRYKIAYPITGSENIKATLIRDSVPVEVDKALVEQTVLGTYEADAGVGVSFQEGDDIVYYDGSTIIASKTIVTPKFIRDG